MNSTRERNVLAAALFGAVPLTGRAHMAPEAWRRTGVRRWLFPDPWTDERSKSGGECQFPATGKGLDIRPLAGLPINPGGLARWEAGLVPGDFRWARLTRADDGAGWVA